MAVFVAIGGTSLANRLCIWVKKKGGGGEGAGSRECDAQRDRVEGMRVKDASRLGGYLPWG